MENSEKNDRTTVMNTIIIVTVILLLAATAISIMGLLAGSVELSNTLLPDNMFKYDGWLIYVFGTVAALGGLFGIFIAFRSLFTTDVQSYEVSSKGVNKTSDGCMAQLMGILVAPVLYAFLAYALIYYLFWGVLEAGAYLLPYLIGALLLGGAIIYFIRMWRERKVMTDKYKVIISTIVLFLYGAMAIFLTNGVSLHKGAQKVTDMMESVSGKNPNVNAAPGQPRFFTLTKDGVGSLVLRKPFKDMSGSDEGLYNKVKKEPYYDEPSGMTFQNYHLYLGNVEVANFLVEEDSSPITRLSITSPYVLLTNGIKIGMPIRDVLAQKGVTASAWYDEIGEIELGALVDITMGGISINAYFWEEHELTENGKAKIRRLTMDNNSVSLTAKDFSRESKVTCFEVQ